MSAGLDVAAVNVRREELVALGVEAAGPAGELPPEVRLALQQAAAVLHGQKVVVRGHVRLRHFEHLGKRRTKDSGDFDRAGCSGAAAPGLSEAGTTVHGGVMAQRRRRLGCAGKGLMRRAGGREGTPASSPISSCTLPSLKRTRRALLSIVSSPSSLRPKRQRMTFRSRGLNCAKRRMAGVGNGCVGQAVAVGEMGRPARLLVPRCVSNHLHLRVVRLRVERAVLDSHDVAQANHHRVRRAHCDTRQTS